MRRIEASIGTRGLPQAVCPEIKSWNLYAAGETVPTREFRWRATGERAEPFPYVEGARLPAYEGAD